MGKNGCCAFVTSAPTIADVIISSCMRNRPLLYRKSDKQRNFVYTILSIIQNNTKSYRLRTGRENSPNQAPRDPLKAKINDVLTREYLQKLGRQNYIATTIFVVLATISIFWSLFHIGRSRLNASIEHHVPPIFNDWRYLGL